LGDIWQRVPEDVIDWIRYVFGLANADVTQRMVNQPNVRETSLDDALVTKISEFAAPKRFASGATVMLEVHNIGGLRQFGSWELADLALIAHVTIQGTPIERKISLLQSKRLYPDNHDVDADDPISFQFGMNGMLDARPNSLGKLSQRFDFSTTSEYGAIKKPNQQLERIKAFEKQFAGAIGYLFYNPSEIPFTTTIPALEHLSVQDPEVGARVVELGVLEEALKAASNGQSPKFHQIYETKVGKNWRLEEWVADLFLRCRVGRVFNDKDYAMISSITARRSGPIGAAIRINIDLPEEQASLSDVN